MLNEQFWRRKNATGLGYQLVLFGIAAIWAGTANGQLLFVANSGNGIIGEYDASTGAAINPQLITGLNNPTGIAISGNDIFVENNTVVGGLAISGWVGEYTLSGQVVNSTLISPNITSGLNAITVTGTNLFVSSGYYEDEGAFGISQYTTSGQLVRQYVGINALSYGLAASADGNDIYTSNFNYHDDGTMEEWTTSGNLVWEQGWPGYVGGLAEPEGVAVTDSDVYVEETGLGGGRIDEYTLSGDRVINFGTGVGGGLAAYGSYLYASTYNGIAEFTTSGQLVDQDFITGLNGADGIAVVLPEPGGILVVPLMFGLTRRRRSGYYFG